MHTQAPIGVGARPDYLGLPIGQDRLPGGFGIAIEPGDRHRPQSLMFEHSVADHTCPARAVDLERLVEMVPALLEPFRPGRLPRNQPEPNVGR